MNFRFARHTNKLNELTRFYTEILGLKILGEFENHDHYNGVVIGKEGADWHLEFTESNHTTNHVTDEDDVLVFYPTTKEEYDELLERLSVSQKIQARNPYWNKNGHMFYDPDGFRIVISPMRFELE